MCRRRGWASTAEELCPSWNPGLSLSEARQPTHPAPRTPTPSSGQPLHQVFGTSLEGHLATGPEPDLVHGLPIISLETHSPAGRTASRRHHAAEGRNTLPARPPRVTRYPRPKKYRNTLLSVLVLEQAVRQWCALLDCKCRPHTLWHPVSSRSECGDLNDRQAAGRCHLAGGARREDECF